MQEIHAGSLYRASQIIGNPAKGIEPIIPVSRSHWFAAVADGRFPQGIKLSERVVVWRGEDLLALLSSITQRQA